MTQGEREKAHLQAARQARAEQTPAEKAMWEMVRDHRCGVHFRRQAVRRPFRLDFFCASLRLAVEVDGSVHDQAAVQRRDDDRQAILEQDYGLRVLRFSNDDVLRRFAQTRSRLLAVIEETKQALPAKQPVQPLDDNPLSHSDGGGVAEGRGGGLS